MKKYTLCILLIALFFAAAAQKAELLIPFLKANKWGYADTLGKLKIPARYDKAGFFAYDFHTAKNNHVYAVAELRGRTIVLNEKGNEVFSGNYADVQVIYKYDKAYFLLTTKQGMKGVRTATQQLIPAVYDELYMNYDDNFAATKKGVTIIFDRNGKLVPKIDAGEMVEIGLAPRDETVPPVDDNFSRSMEDQRKEFHSLLSMNYGTDSFRVVDDITYSRLATIFFKKNKQAIGFPFELKDSLLFFSKTFKIERIIPSYLPRQTRAFLIADSMGKKGVLLHNGTTLVPLSYDKITYRSELQMFDLELKGKHGFYTLYYGYRLVKPKYDSIFYNITIPVSNRWTYLLYVVTLKGKTRYVSGGGVEFFSEN